MVVEVFNSCKLRASPFLLCTSQKLQSQERLCLSLLSFVICFIIVSLIFLSMEKVSSVGFPGEEIKLMIRDYL
jgi:hypothetical protein